MSALFRWPCSISIHLSRRYIMCGLHPFPLTTQYFYSFVSQVCHCGRPPFSVGHLTFLFIYLLDLSLLVSAPFRWPCNISIHLFPRFVIADVRPFPLAIQHFYSFLKQFIVRGSQFFFIMCPSFLSLLALFRWSFYVCRSYRPEPPKNAKRCNFHLAPPSTSAVCICMRVFEVEVAGLFTLDPRAHTYVEVRTRRHKHAPPPKGIAGWGSLSEFCLASSTALGKLDNLANSCDDMHFCFTTTLLLQMFLHYCSFGALVAHIFHYEKIRLFLTLKYCI